MAALTHITFVGCLLEQLSIKLLLMQNLTWWLLFCIFLEYCNGVFAGLKKKKKKKKSCSSSEMLLLESWLYICTP